MKVGTVYLVGAGPGDPGLLTVRGRECLARADIVFYDGLVNPLMLRWTNGECIRTARVRRKGIARVEQDEVNQKLIDAARSGRTVVRLKGGDPFLFGRGSEEAAALANAGIPYEVVPGVTAAIAAGAYAGLSLTHRDMASAVAFVTGHENPLKPASRLDYSQLARFPGTLVFYMGLHRLPQIAASLIEAGLPEATPAAVLCQATLPSQQIVVGTLADLPERASGEALRPPSLIVVGECVTQREKIVWFERRPLFGQRIGITRPETGGQASEPGVEQTIARCLELGAEPVLMPLIAVRPVANPAVIDTMLARLDEVDWLIFTSANAVRAVFTRLWETGGDVRRLGRVRLACIGPATAAALEAYALRPDVVPPEHCAEGLAEVLKPHVSGARVLWARASRGRNVLPDELTRAGAIVEQSVVYENVDVDQLPADLASDVATSPLDWIALSSPSIARALARLWPDGLREHLGTRTRIAAISPITVQAAEAAGIPVTVTASEYTWEGLFSAIAAAARSD